MRGGWDVAGRALRPAREDLGVEVHLRAADGRAASERAGRSAQERFVPFERLTAPTDGNKFGTISGLKCGRTSLGFAFNLEPAAEAFFGQY